MDVGHSAPAVRRSKLADYLHGVVPNRLDTANTARLVNGIDGRRSPGSVRLRKTQELIQIKAIYLIVARVIQ